MNEPRQDLADSPAIAAFRGVSKRFGDVVAAEINAIGTMVLAVSLILLVAAQGILQQSRRAR